MRCVVKSANLNTISRSFLVVIGLMFSAFEISISSSSLLPVGLFVNLCPSVTCIDYNV